MWEEKRIGDFAELITKGTTPTSIGCKFEDKGINFIKSESIGSGRKLDKSKYAHISEETHQKLKRSQIQTGDILFSMAGVYLGKTAIVTDEDVPANTNQAVAIIRLDPLKINPEFVYYMLNQKSVVAKVNSTSSQSAQPNINLKDIGNISFLCPEREVQDKIVAILSDIDTKIEVNKKINDNLVEQAQAIFKAWFIDYTWFNGDKPNGWKRATLGDLVELRTDTFRPEKNPELVVEHYSIPAYDDNRYPVFEIAAGIKSNKYVVTKNEVMFSKLNPDTKRAWRPYCLSDLAVASTEFMIYRPKNTLQKDFIYSIIDSKPFSDFVCLHTTGSTGSRQRAVPKTTLNYELFIPDEELINIFVSLVTPIYDLIEKNIIENQRLSEARDKILPRLMSGELSVSGKQ